jgi:cell division protein FtsN
LDTNSISNLGIPKETPFLHKPESKGTSILTTIAIAVSLIIGAGGAFLAFTTSTTLQQTQAEIAQFKQSGGSVTGQSDPRISKLFTAVDQINTRLNELSIMVDGPISHMNESGSATDNTTHMKLQELAKHVAMIDQVIAGLESQQDKLADSMTTTSHTKTTVAVKPVSASPSADSKGRWALNLQSLSDMKNAERTVQELKDIGVSSVVRKSDHTDHVWYRVRIEGFQTYNEAKEYIKKLPESPLTANTWVTNN